MSVKFAHLGECSSPPDDLFPVLEDAPINMFVKPGSKIPNLLLYAVEKLKNEVNQLIWWSKHGAISKTVSCAELFKQKWSEEISNRPDGYGRLYQQNQIFYQRCKCSVLGTQFECVIEEPAIAILFSKTPIPGQCNTTSIDDLTSDVFQTAQPTRKRFDHLRKRKRDVAKTQNPIKGNKISDSISIESTSETSLPVNQSPRLAPAVSKVSQVLPKLKSRKKRRLNN